MIATSLSEQLAELAKDWRQLSANHMVVAIGCSCGFPSAHISIADLESDILDYLRSRYSTPGTLDGTRIDGCRSILELLDILGEPELAKKATEIASSLARSIHSFRQMHGGRTIRSAIGEPGSSSAF